MTPKECLQRVSEVDILVITDCHEVVPNALLAFGSCTVCCSAASLIPIISLSTFVSVEAY